MQYTTHINGTEVRVTDNRNEWANKYMCRELDEMAHTALRNAIFRRLEHEILFGSGEEIKLQ